MYLPFSKLRLSGLSEIVSLETRKISPQVTSQLSGNFTVETQSFGKVPFLCCASFSLTPKIL